MSDEEASWFIGKITIDGAPLTDGHLNAWFVASRTAWVTNDSRKPFINDWVGSRQPGKDFRDMSPRV